MTAHAFVDDLDAPELSPEDVHHLERVLRLRVGEELTVSDGCGGWRRCRFGPALEPIGDVRHDPRQSPLITVAFAVVKGQRPEWAVQKLTEIGVDRIVPLVSNRSVVRWPVGAPCAHVDRLRRVAREASMQSRRTWLPLVGDVATFASMAVEAGVSLAHPDGDPPSLLRPTVLIGPEGGWDAAELGAVLPRVRLGAHVLRTETAALVAGTLLAALRDDRVRNGQG